MMKNKKRLGFLAFLLVAVGCTKQNPDIIRVSGPYFDKAYFNSQWEHTLVSPDEWYYRVTIVDTPTNTEAASIASGHWLHPETLRFELTEKYLVGWRAHAQVPGSENDLTPGAAPHYRGVPVVVYAITDHFDIAREYDPVTGERSNVVAENRDRAWNRRRFVRVDFSKDLVHVLKREDAYPYFWGSENITMDGAYTVGYDDPADPKRPRVEANYLEFTNKQGYKPDFFGFIGAYGAGYAYDNASPVVDIRSSFLRKAPSDYEPLALPNVIHLADGKTEKIWERFGFYRAAFNGQQTWDQRRGSVESNLNTNITRFNIWQETKRGDTLIPIEERVPKPIIYYTNVEHPENLMAASQRVAAAWDRTFRELVFFAQPGKYASVDAVPPMWILVPNSCNVASVDAWLSALGTSRKAEIEKQAGFKIGEVGARIAEANSPSNFASFTEKQNKEAQAKADLERICAALEYNTQGDNEPFRYQRSGDLRYNLMNLITKQAQTPWSGLGPMLADSLSGEIIQAQANVNLWYIDRRAAWASRQIDMMNGKIDLNNILNGFDIKAAMADAMKGSASSADVSPAGLRKMDARFDHLRESGRALIDLSEQHIQGRNARFLQNKDDRRWVERELQNDGESERGFLKVLGLHADLSKSTGDLSEVIVDGISPARGRDLVARFFEKQENDAKAALLPMDPPEMIDPLVVGLAIKYKDMDPKERLYRIREDVYTAVMLHEIGHNMGLAHNMSGSSDAVNYGEKFWQLQALPADLVAAKKIVTDKDQKKQLEACAKAPYPITTQSCLGQEEVMYSSIMDYHAAWNSDFGGLGLYDKAAIKWGYAQLVETFPDASLQLDPKRKNLTRWLALNDWQKIPTEFVKNSDAIHQRAHEKYEWHKTDKPYPANGVPYRYCIDSSGAFGPQCKAFDFGPDMRAQAKWNETQYWQHYFFTHFSNERVLTYDWDFERIVSRDLSIMADYNNIMRWYYYQRVTDPEFRGSDAERDYLSATVSGLNHFAHVLSHPKPEVHASVPLFALDAIVTLDANANRLEPGQLLVTLKDLDPCIQSNVVNMKDKVATSAKAGYVFAKVPLGEGRPFYLGDTGAYEDFYLSYVGSFFTKLYATYFLSTPRAWFPRNDASTDPRSVAINWHRLFPKEVGKLFFDMVTSNWSQIGPLVDAKGNLVRRNLLDPVTLEAPDYSGMSTVMPGVASFLPYRAMFYAASLMSGNRTPELDPVKSMQIIIDGGRGDIRGINVDGDNQAVFTDPQDGWTYRAFKIGDFPYAYELVKSLNVEKDRFVRLDRCVNDENARKQDSFCACVKMANQPKSGKQSCCGDGNRNCPQLTLENVGEGLCSMTALLKRRDQAKEDLDAARGFVNDMQMLYENYVNNL